MACLIVVDVGYESKDNVLEPKECFRTSQVSCSFIGFIPMLSRIGPLVALVVHEEVEGVGYSISQSSNATGCRSLHQPYPS